MQEETKANPIVLQFNCLAKFFSIFNIQIATSIVHIRGDECTHAHDEICIARERYIQLRQLEKHQKAQGKIKQSTRLQGHSPPIQKDLESIRNKKKKKAM